MKTLGDPVQMFDHTFAQLPPTLQEQKEELIRELAADEQETADGEGAQHG